MDDMRANALKLSDSCLGEESFLRIRAEPKSVILMCMSLLRSIFSGFRSLSSIT